VVERLPLAVRQLVEIARALGRKAQLFVMDEPTSALADPDVERFFLKMEAMRAAGRAIVFVSHRLDEIERLADRITVLRDGRVVASGVAALLDRSALLHALAGSDNGPRPRLPSTPSTGAALRVRGLTLTGAAPMRLGPVTLEVRPGEIVGVAGLSGSGVELLCPALFGLLPVTGTIALGGRPETHWGPARALAQRVVLVSGDRARSVIPSASVIDNAGLSSLGRFTRGGWVRARALGREVASVAKRVGLRAPSLRAPLAELSGGNQQKVALMRALLVEPKVMLLDDPTRGIDVGSKAELHTQIRELAARGVAVVLVSSDTQELVDLSQRVLVLARGRVVAELGRDGLTRESVVSAAVSAAQPSSRRTMA
jgi:ABC-type sugar transport system ATPase subunit